MTIPPILMTLDAKAVESAEDVDVMRQIRNFAVALGTYSHDNSAISEQRQRAWWVAMKGRVRAWLYYQSGVLLGYGAVIQDSQGLWWDSVGVLPRHQGFGFGSLITADLARRAGVTVHSKVRATNAPARAMHHADLWEDYPILPSDPNYVGFVTRQESQ